MSVTENVLPAVFKKNQTIEQLGQNYFAKLVGNITIMLRYIEENGIVIPDDLRNKISALFVGAPPIANSADQLSAKPPTNSI